MGLKKRMKDRTQEWVLRAALTALDTVICDAERAIARSQNGYKNVETYRRVQHFKTVFAGGVSGGTPVGFAAGLTAQLRFIANSTYAYGASVGAPIDAQNDLYGVLLLWLKLGEDAGTLEQVKSLSKLGRAIAAAKSAKGITIRVATAVAERYAPRFIASGVPVVGWIAGAAAGTAAAVRDRESLDAAIVQYYRIKMEG